METLFCICLGVLVTVHAQNRRQETIFESNYSTSNLKHYRSEDGKGNYNFGFDIDDGASGSFRRESGNEHGIKKGSYGFKDVDGRVRIVHYIADAFGFRVGITSNEPGVKTSSPADVSINTLSAVYLKDTQDAPLPSMKKTVKRPASVNSLNTKSQDQMRRAPAVFAKPGFVASESFPAAKPVKNAAAQSRESLVTLSSSNLHLKQKSAEQLNPSRRRRRRRRPSHNYRSPVTTIL